MIDCQELVKYIKSRDFDQTKNIVKPDAFSLRNNPITDPTKKSEDYLSFFYAKNLSCVGVAEVRNIMIQTRGFLFNKNHNYFLYIDVENTCEVINTPHQRIKFQDEKHPHYGMYYLFDIASNLDNYLEIKTMLAELSEVCDCSRDGSKIVYLEKNA